jgi:phosphohistidine phosphatase SixA
MFWLLLSPAHAQAELRATDVPPGAIILLRHAQASGVGDPPSFKLGDCSTQRNLDERGRDQARRFGERLRQAGVIVARVLSSQWCRTQETASLAFPGLVQEEPVFNSFFEDRGIAAAVTAKASALLVQWQGPGALVVVTHQVNITALTGVVPRSGEAVVLQVEGGVLKMLGRLYVE